MGGILIFNGKIIKQKMMKNTTGIRIFVQILCLMTFIPMLLQGQGSCYQRLEDASGVIPAAARLSELEQAACRLIDSLPAAYQDSFKVFSGGFYLHQEHTGGGFPDAFQRLIDVAAAQSTYYLLFGKQTDKDGMYTRFWVDLKLPEIEEFECLTESFPPLITEKIRHKIEESYNQNGRSHYFYPQAEIAGMQELKRIVNNIKNGQCCDFEAGEIFEVLNGMGFVGYPCVISGQLGARPGQGQNRSVTITDYAELDFEMDGMEINSNQVLSDLLANLSNQGNGYITKNESFCDNNKFDEVKGNYEANLDDYDIWYHIWDNPNEGEDDIVFIKSERFDEIQAEVNVTSLPVNDGNFEWLDKATLRDYVANNFCTGCSTGQLENMTGARFEAVWHQFATSNFNNLGWDYQINTATFFGDRNTVPDAISNAICGVGITPTIYPESSWYEVKAKAGTVYNSTDTWQIGSHITAMGNSPLILPARQANCAKLSIITTSDCNVAASVYRKGTRNQIDVNHYYAQYFIDNLGRMKVKFKLYLPCFFGFGEFPIPDPTVLIIVPAIL
jgi:hypothetical protein